MEHARRLDKDREQVRVLAAFHWVLAGLAALFVLFPLLHLIFGILVAFGEHPQRRNDEFARLIGWFFILISSAWIVLLLAFAICLALAGRSLWKFRRYDYCLVMAGLACIAFPVGTALGVFTILVLMKDSVRAMFSGELVAADVR